MKNGLDVETFDVIVAGAGPSGMAAAKVAARDGAKVLLVDEQASPGGQIFRRSTVSCDDGVPTLPGYANAVQDVYADASRDGIRYRPMSCAWGVSSDGSIFVSGEAGTTTYRADNLVIATGVSEWVLPVKGWTLPGVTSAGGAQALLKTSRVLVGQRVAIGGSGPLLLQVAAQLAAAGANVVAVFDATPPAQHVAAAFQVLRHPPTASLGMKLLGQLRLRNVKIHRGWAISDIRGEASVTAIRASRIEDDNCAHIDLDVDAVCLSNGLIPAVELAALRGCALTFDGPLGVWEIERREGVATSVPGVFAVGDGAHIGGARKAILEGQLAGVCVLQRLGRAPADEFARHRRMIERKLKALQPIRTYAERTMGYCPGAIAAIDPTVTVCRCEDVQLASVHAAIDQGARSLHELRTRCRIGMGNCQGRTCVPTVTRVLSVRANLPLADIPYPRPRPPVRPMSLRELAPITERLPS